MYTGPPFNGFIGMWEIMVSRMMAVYAGFCSVAGFAGAGRGCVAGGEDGSADPRWRVFVSHTSELRKLRHRGSFGKSTNTNHSCSDAAISSVTPRRPGTDIRRSLNLNLHSRPVGEVGSNSQNVRSRNAIASECRSPPVPGQSSADPVLPDSLDHLRIRHDKSMAQDIRC